MGKNRPNSYDYPPIYMNFRFIPVACLFETVNVPTVDRISLSFSSVIEFATGKLFCLLLILSFHLNVSMGRPARGGAIKDTYLILMLHHEVLTRS